LRRIPYGIYKAYSVVGPVGKLYFILPIKKKPLAKIWQNSPAQRPVTNGGEQTPDQIRLSDTFQTQGPLLRGKRKNSLDSPRSIFCGVRASPLIMFRRTPREIAGYAAVVQRLISLAY
jgi:hypothetical protein